MRHLFFSPDSLFSLISLYSLFFAQTESQTRTSAGLFPGNTDTTLCFQLLQDWLQTFFRDMSGERPGSAPLPISAPAGVRPEPSLPEGLLPGCRKCTWLMAPGIVPTWPSAACKCPASICSCPSSRAYTRARRNVWGLGTIYQTAHKAYVLSGEFRVDLFPDRQSPFAHSHEAALLRPGDQPPQLLLQGSKFLLRHGRRQRNQLCRAGRISRESDCQSRLKACTSPRLTASSCMVICVRILI